jgi:hypothetical protein
MKKAIAVFVFMFAISIAQARAGEGQVEFFAGYLNPGKLNLDTALKGLDFRGTSLFGVRGEVGFLKIFGIEENLEFSPRLFNSTLCSCGKSTADVRGLLNSTNLVVNAPLGRFVPYVTVGVGLLKPWGAGLATIDTTFAANYGGGVKLNRLIGPMGLRAEVRGWRTGDIAGNGGINIFEASAGITFTWGKHK